MWKILLDGVRLPVWYKQKYSGYEIIDGRKYWMLEMCDTLIEGNIKDYFRKECGMKSDDEFYQFFCAGKCGAFSLALGLVIRDLLNRGTKIVKGDDNARMIKVEACKLAVMEDFKFEQCVNCYEKNRDTVPIEKWDCDYTGSEFHTAILLTTDTGARLVLDTTAYQYGVCSMNLDEYPMHLQYITSSYNESCVHYANLHSIISVEECWKEQTKKINANTDRIAMASILLGELRKELNIQEPKRVDVKVQVRG